MSITVTLGVAVMLLSFMLSCGGEPQDVVEVTFDPERTYTMRTTDVSSLISDSGITRYRIEAKEWLIYGKAADPHWYFPEGFYLAKFDTLFRTEASVRADTAYYYDKRGLWQLIGHVDVESLQGERFQTEELFWNQKEERVYSDKYIRIEQADKVITGIGFESNQTMTQYKIFNSQGIFPVSESPAERAEGEATADSVSVVEPMKE